MTEPPPWVVTYVVSGVCFVLGGLLLVSVLFRLFVGIAPAVILELSEQPFPRGRRIRITVIQPGPVGWSAFSVKFECLEETYKWDQRAGGEGNERGEMFRTTLTFRVVQVHELLSPQPIQAQRGSDWRRTFECVLPDNSPITLKNDDDAVFWQVVVKGSKSVVSGLEDVRSLRRMRREGRGILRSPHRLGLRLDKRRGRPGHCQASTRNPTGYFDPEPADRSTACGRR